MLRRFRAHASHASPCALACVLLNKRYVDGAGAVAVPTAEGSPVKDPAKDARAGALLDAERAVSAHRRLTTKACSHLALC